MKIHGFSLDVCKKYVKITGLLSFGRDPLWGDLCKESLLWDGERAEGGEEEKEKEKEVGPKEN